jgi:hypothetical protein
MIPKITLLKATILKIILVLGKVSTCLLPATTSFLETMLYPMDMAYISLLPATTISQATMPQAAE